MVPPPWLAGLAVPDTSHCSFLPLRASLESEQLQALSVELGRKTVIRSVAATLSRSLRDALAVSPDKCPTREESPSA